MSNFNIIGNGFDLYHGLPTRYYHFACYLVSKNEKLYDDLSDMYGFSSGVLHHFTEDFEREIDDRYFWQDFENMLGNLSSEWVEYSLLDDLGLEYPDAVRLSVDRPDHVDEVKQLLNKWLQETVDVDSNYSIVKKMLRKQKREFSKDDAFISFNYTHTLEKIYRVDKILHIHGEINPAFQENELIIGHGNDQVIQEMMHSIEQLQPYVYEQPANNRIQEYEFEIDILQRLRKPVWRLLPKLIQFLGEIDVPDKIYSFGFSFGDVDMPYIQAIREKWPNCPWEFSYYSSSEKDHILQIAQLLGLRDDQYHMFEFKNDVSGSIMQRIIEKRCITEYPIL